MGIMFKLLSGLAAVQAVETEEQDDKRVKTTHSIKARHSHHLINIKKYHHANGIAHLHYCMDRRHHMVPCTHVMDDFSYSRGLIEEIIATLPRFVHKHTVIYRMYTTLKLYYLHQQELLNEVLSILKLHIHSADLAKTLMAYMATMRGGSFGWVAQITALLKTHLKMEVTQMQTLVAHHRLVYKLHSIIRHAAMRSHRQIHKLYAVMHKHGFMHKGLLRSRRTMITTHHHIMRKIRHVFRTHRVHTSVVRHTHTVVRHSSYSFRSSHSTSKSVRIMLSKHSVHTTKKMLHKMLKRAKTTTTRRHIKKALKLVKKVAKKAKKTKKGKK